MIHKYDVVRLRGRLGLSQEKFAEKLGVSVSAVGKWETGQHKPRGLSLRAVERLTKLSRRKMNKRLQW
jgi:putative transcriptional regulator